MVSQAVPAPAPCNSEPQTPRPRQQIYMGGYFGLSAVDDDDVAVKNCGPFLDPCYDPAPNIYGTPTRDYNF